MSRAVLPPTFETLVDDDKRATLTWAAFFESLSQGDFGTAWTPTFDGLTEVGSATKTGVYYKLSQRLAFFRITITPETNTSSVLGTTFCNNFPLTIANNGLCASISSYTANVSGISDSKIYTSTWTTLTTPITIVGIVEVR